MNTMLEINEKSEIQPSGVGPLVLDDIHYLWPMMQRHLVRAGEGLWREGELDGCWGMVVRGRVKVVKETENPGHRVVLGLFGPGSLIFDRAFGQDHPRETSAVAMDEVEILYLPKQHFEKILTDRPSLGLRLYRFVLASVAEQLRHANRRLASIF